MPLQTVRDWLGHTSVAQTSTYLASTLQTQHEAMRRFDERRGLGQGNSKGEQQEMATRSFGGREAEGGEDVTTRH